MRFCSYLNVDLFYLQVYELASYIKGSTAVKNVSLCNTGLDDDDLQQLAESLETTSSQVNVRHEHKSVLKLMRVIHDDKFYERCLDFYLAQFVNTTSLKNI